MGVLLAAGLIWAPAASAHAVLVSSSPVDGSRVNTEPAEVRLTFDESVGLIPADEEVISVTGLRADTGQPRLTQGGTTIVLPLRPGAYPAGRRTSPSASSTPRVQRFPLSESPQPCPPRTWPRSTSASATQAPGWPGIRR